MREDLLKAKNKICGYVLKVISKLLIKKVNIEVITI